MTLLTGLFPSRRELLKKSAALTALAAARTLRALEAPAEGEHGEQASAPRSPSEKGNNLFSEIGVRTLINARGTYTIITGSRSLPQVKQAMLEASNYFVHLDELMPAVGREIANLMGAEAAIVTTGCEAAIALATVACIAGANLERTQAYPYVKTPGQVIVPKHSRNPYEFGIRMSGAEIVEVASAEELEQKISPQTAMIYILSSPAAESGPLSIPSICGKARHRGVPTFVDAAAEEPLAPNIHIANGATLVGYSGGKCIRGPQAAGLLLGQKDLIEAAWFNVAPHHNWGRALKVGKEEIMGMLAAVCQWYKRDHDAEQAMWRGWLETIESAVRGFSSVRTEYLEPEDLSNRAPRLAIHWDAAKLGITGEELADRLDKGSPRILVQGGEGQRPARMQSSIAIMPYMLEAGEERLVAAALADVFTHPGRYENPEIPSGAPAGFAGTWSVSIHYIRGVGDQRFVLKQAEDRLTGTQHGEIYQATLTGLVHANTVELHSTMAVPGNEIDWTFRGELNGNSIEGIVEMGEYGRAKWSAVRA